MCITAEPTARKRNDKSIKIHIYHISHTDSSIMVITQTKIPVSYYLRIFISHIYEKEINKGRPTHLLKVSPYKTTEFCIERRKNCCHPRSSHTGHVASFGREGSWSSYRVSRQFVILPKKEMKGLERIHRVTVHYLE
jgi:hypothetical protein